MRPAARDFQAPTTGFLEYTLTVGDLVLVTRHEGTDAEVTVLSGASGKAVAGAEVMLYRFDWNKRHQRVESKFSDERGIVQFHIVQQNSQYFLVARKGEQIAFDPQHLYAHRQGQPADSSSTLLFTDRSIYRPLQKLFWKAVLYKSSANRTRFETSPASTFTVSLKDINRIRKSNPERSQPTISAQPPVNLPFHPAEPWADGISKAPWAGPANVQVEEYKRPTFEAKMLDPEEPLRLNQPARLKGEAKYYFGLPVTNGQVKWLVRREPVFPWWWGYCWWGGYRFQFTPLAGGRQRDCRAKRGWNLFIYILSGNR